MTESGKEARMGKKSTVAVAATCACAIALGVPSAAIAAQESQEMIGGELVSTTTYTSSEKAPSPKDRIISMGEEWELESFRISEDPSYEKERRSFRYETTADVAVSQESSKESLFPKSHAISEGNFSGDIPLSAVTSVPVYRTVSGQVDRSYTVSGGLATNDVDALYEAGYRTMNFETRSAAAYGATETQRLDLAYPEFFVVSRDEYGIPSEYGVVLNYRGSESWLEIDHYVATAVYEGDVESSETGYSLVASYEPAEAVAEPDRPEPDPAPFNVAPFAVGGTAAGAIGFAVFWLSRRVKLCTVKNNTVEIVEKIKPVRDGRDYIISATAAINLSDQYFVAVPAKWSHKKEKVEVRANGAVVYSGPWAKRIDLN